MPRPMPTFVHVERRRLRSRPMAIKLARRARQHPRISRLIALIGILLPLLFLRNAFALHDDYPPTDGPMHVVASGDTLFAIALANGVSVSDLVAWNDLPDPDALRVGQRLRVGKVADPAPAPAMHEYVVQPGDNLSAIGRALGVSVQQLVDWNGIADPDVIAMGQVLIVGAGAPAMSPPRPTYAAGSAPNITKKPSRNIWEGRPFGEPIAIVLHTAHGSMEGMDRWFQNDESQHSAHFGVGLDGRIHQYVELKDRAWANGTIETGSTWPGPAWINPNHITVSIETEDLADASQPVTEAQYQATLAAARIAVKQYPKIRYLVTHRAISPETRPSDPGSRWIRSGRFAAMASELGLEPVP
jgi:LysM repeat protein